MKFSKFLVAATTFFIASSITLPSAQAEVKFGKGVRIGGHDVSGQTYNKKKRGKFYIYKKKPKKAGCYWQKNKDGSRTKICHLKRKTK
jgi:ribosomal protein L21